MSRHSLARFFRFICPLAHQIAMNLPHVVHCGRPNQYHSHAGLAPHRYFAMSERMFDRTHSRFYGRSIVVWPFTRSGTLLTAQRTVQVLLREAQYALGSLLQRLCRTFVG